MSTAESAPAGRPRPSLSRAGSDRIVVAAFACLALLSAVWLLREGRGLTFFFDEWNFLFGRRDGLHGLFDPHNGHLSLVPVAIYKLLFATVGVEPYWAYRLLAVLFHVLCAGLVFALARRAAGNALALAAATVLLLLGAAWQVAAVAVRDLLHGVDRGRPGRAAGAGGRDAPRRRRRGRARVRRAGELGARHRGRGGRVRRARRAPGAQAARVGGDRAGRRVRPVVHDRAARGRGAAEQPRRGAVVCRRRGGGRRRSGRRAGAGVGARAARRWASRWRSCAGRAAGRCRRGWRGSSRRRSPTGACSRSPARISSSRSPAATCTSARCSCCWWASSSCAAARRCARPRWRCSAWRCSRRSSRTSARCATGANGLRGTTNDVRAALAAVELAGDAVPAATQPEPAGAPQVTAGDYRSLVADLGSPIGGAAHVLDDGPLTRVAVDAALTRVLGVTVGAAGAAQPAPGGRCADRRGSGRRHVARRRLVRASTRRPGRVRRST